MFVVHFCPLGSRSGHGSRDLIESGSSPDTDPDPQHWFRFIPTVLTLSEAGAAARWASPRNSAWRACVSWCWRMAAASQIIPSSRATGSGSLTPSSRTRRGLSSRSASYWGLLFFRRAELDTGTGIIKPHICRTLCPYSLLWSRKSELRLRIRMIF